MTPLASPTGSRTPGRGRLVVISGPSGAGKTTVAHRLLEDPRFARAITATTRAPRAGEHAGVDYHFLSPEEFRRRISENGFLEHALVFGNHYGTPREAPEAILASGRHCVLVVDVQGAETLRGMGVDACYVFLRAPTAEELRRRLEHRGLDHPGEIARRLDAAVREMAEAQRFDHVFVNDTVEATACRVAAALGLDLAPPRPGAGTPDGPVRARGTE